MLKKVDIEKSIGLPIFHDLTAIMENGFKGVCFKRGHIVEEKDLEILRNIGKEHLFVGELDEGFVHEVDAIEEISAEVANENISHSEPSEGKVSFKSKVYGLFVINREGLLALNSVGDYTFATKSSYLTVKEGDELVGGRIVPLFTERSQVEKAREVCRLYKPIFEVKKFQKLRVGVIITGNEIYTGRIKDMFEPVIREKLSHFEHEIIGIEKCPDDKDFIKNVANGYFEKGVDLVVFSGGMSVDPDDVTPKIIKELSDEFIVQGIPVQPGNMLTVGKKDGAYLVGVPGASIHAKFTSFDIFLPRFFAKIDLKKQDFIELGEGGLYSKK